LEEKLRIIFISQVTITDINERNIYCDLIREFILHSHHVDIFTAFERRNKTSFSKLEQGENYTITRIKTPNLQKSSKFEKALGHLLFDRILLRALKKHLNPSFIYNISLYYTPPITITESLKFLKEKYKTFNYLLLKDIFPQNAVDIGLMRKNSLSYKYFRKIEKEFYHLSDMIGCMSPKNVSYLLQHNPNLLPEKVECNPNSISHPSNIFRPLNTFRVRNKIPDNATIFLYGGNLGKPQGIEFIIELLSWIQNTDNAFFLIVGSGTEYPKLKKWIEENNPKNILLLPYMNKNEYDELVSEIDVGLIFLDHKFTIPNFPSRLLSYLENKKPVLAFTDINTDIGDILVKNKIGGWAPSNDRSQALNLIKEYIEFDKSILKELGNNGFQFLLENYLTIISYNKIISAYHKYNQKTFY
jgi:glycosyltransferase involved in cell wall biosynthesis